MTHIRHNNKIVFINQAAGYLTKDLVNVFAERFGSIALIAGEIFETGNDLNPKVRISKIGAYKKKNIFLRITSWLLATAQAIFLVNVKYRSYHLFLISNPPTLAFLPLFCKNRYSVLIYDVYPDGLVAGRFISASSWVYKIWAERNRRFFLKAMNIFTLTEGMANTLTKYVNIERIKVIAPWSLFNSDHKIEKKNNRFIIKHNLEDYFLVMYSGNIGLGHRVDSLIEAAIILRNQKDIKFVIIGEGWNKQSVEELIEEYNLNNCLVLPFQPPEMFQYSLPAADIGVVSIATEGARVCAPSKTYNLINLEIPLLAITEQPSELANLIQKYDIGASFRFDQIMEMAEFILLVKEDKGLVNRYKKNLKECASIFTSANANKYLDNFNL